MQISEAETEEAILKQLRSKKVLRADELLYAIEKEYETSNTPISPGAGRFCSVLKELQRESRINIEGLDGGSVPPSSTIKLSFKELAREAQDA